MKASAFLYHCLRPFTAAESSSFYGRRTEINYLVSRLQASRLSVVYGDSKTGMTSLLRAGVFAKLQQICIPTIVQDEDSTKADRPISLPVYIDYNYVYKRKSGVHTNVNASGEYIIKPASTIYRSFAHCLRLAFNKASVSLKWSQDLPGTPKSFFDYLCACGESIECNNPGGFIYIIIDQAEIALLKSSDNANFFEDILLPILQRADIKINFLLSIRSDFVVLLDRFRDTKDFLVNRYELKPLSQHVFENEVLPAMISEYSRRKVFIPGQSEQAADCAIFNNNAYQNIKDAIDHYQKLTPQTTLKDMEKSISPTFLKLIFNSCDRFDCINIEAIVDKHLAQYFSTFTNDKKVIAAILIHYISLAGPGKPTSERLYDLIFQDRYMLLNAPFTDYELTLTQSDKPSTKFVGLGDAVLGQLYAAKLVMKHGSSYEIHPDLQLALLKWKESILSNALLHNASQASSIASQSIIASLKLSQSMEMDLPKTELSGLLALQAYSFSKYTNADFKTPLFDEAFREFLKYPYFVKELVLDIDEQTKISGVALSCDNKRIAAVDSCGRIMIFEADFLRRDWQFKDVKQYPPIQSKQGSATSIVFHPKKSHILFIGYSNGAVERCSLQEGLGSHDFYQCKEPIDDYLGERPSFGVGPGPLAFNKDGSWLAFGSWDHQVTLWDLRDNDMEPKLNGDYQLENRDFCDDWIWTISFSHITNKLAVGYRNGMLIIYDLKELGQEKSKINPPYDLIHLSDILATSPFSWKKNAPFDPDERPFEIFSLSYSPDDKWIAVGSRGLFCVFDPLLADRQKIIQILKEWEIQKQNHTFSKVHDPICKQTIVRYSSEKERGIRSLAFSHDSKYLCVGGDDFIEASNGPKRVDDQTLRLWDITKRDAPAIILRASTKHPLGINCVLFAKRFTYGDFTTNPFILTSSWDGTVRCWYLERDRPEPLHFGGQKGPVRAVSWSPDGKWLASAAWDKENSVCLWNCEWLWPGTREVDAIRRPFHLPGSFYGNSNLAFSVDNKFLASGGYQGDNFVRIWDLEKVRSWAIEKGFPPDPMTLPGHAGEVRALAFSEDYLASGGWDRTLNLWDAKTFKLLKTLKGFPGAIRCLALSKDQKWLAVGTGTPISEPHSTLFLLDLQKILGQSKPGENIDDVFSTDKHTLSLVEPSTKETFSVAICPNSKLLASVGRDNRLRIYDIVDKRFALIEPKSEDAKEDVFAGSSIAFSAKGTMMAVGSWSSDENIATLRHGSVWLWQVSHLQEEMSKRLSESLSKERQISHPILLQLPPGQIIDLPARNQNHVTSIAFSPAPEGTNRNDDSHDYDSQFLAFGSNDWTIRIWTVGTGMLARLTARQITRNLTISEWNQYIDQGYKLSPYEYTLPEHLIPKKTENVPASTRPSWLCQHLDSLGRPPFRSSTSSQDEPDEQQQPADA